MVHSFKDHGAPLNTCLSPISLLKSVTSLENVIRNSKKRRSMDNENQNHHATSINDQNFDENEILSIVKITPTMLLNMCPTLLSQLDEKSCLDVTKIEMGKKDKAFAMGNFE